MEALRVSVESNLRSVVQSCKEGVPLLNLSGDYATLVGKQIPFKELGFQNLKSMLVAMPDVVRIQLNRQGPDVVFAVADKNTAHIQSLISRQRTAKSKSRMPRKTRRQFTRPGTWRPPQSSSHPCSGYVKSARFTPNRKSDDFLFMSGPRTPQQSEPVLRKTIAFNASGFDRPPLYQPFWQDPARKVTVEPLPESVKNPWYKRPQQLSVQIPAQADDLVSGDQKETVTPIVSPTTSSLPSPTAISKAGKSPFPNDMVMRPRRMPRTPFRPYPQTNVKKERDPPAEDVAKDENGHGSAKKPEDNTYLGTEVCKVSQEIKIPSDMMEPLFCKLCDAKLNGTLQANAHYEGKNHLKKERQYLKQMNNKKGIKKPLPKGKTEKKQLEEEYCKICDVAFTSEMQAKQHYNGRNHQRRSRGEPPLPKGFFNRLTGKWQRQPPSGIQKISSRASKPKVFIPASVGTSVF